MPKGHAVVDGSNLATEGRTEPSLAQLDEAVAAFATDHDFAHVTVVVDASFEHRVTDKERVAAKRAIDDGRIITPPAGVVGRGDTFILQIADRAGAVVVSNDSFQEFHGQFEWLFDEGRLIGGKPVQHVGWVFVPRVPVRGPTSREAVRKAKSKAVAPADESSRVRAAKKARPAPKKTATKKTTAKNVPPKKAPVKKTTAKKAPLKKSAAKNVPPKKAPVKRTTAKKAPTERAGVKKAKAAGSTPGDDQAVRGDDNPIRAWRRFRHEHPVGSKVVATVERFSSHGAYAVTADGLSAYVPSRLLADPPPSRARDVIAEGESLTFIVHEFDEGRRGIDLGLLRRDGKTPRNSAKKSGSASNAAKRAEAKESAAKPTRQSRGRQTAKRSTSRR